MNKPVAYWDGKHFASKDKSSLADVPLYPQETIDKAFENGFKAGKVEGWKAHKFHHSVKELTDEEIIELTPFKKHPYDEFVEYEKEDLIDFAKAILRKAQEK